MAVRVVNKKGREVVLLNLAEKASKYVNELSNNVHLDNLGMIKVKKNGKPRRLNDCQRSYRAGYLQARKDNAACYKGILKKYS